MFITGIYRTAVAALAALTRYHALYMIPAGVIYLLLLKQYRAMVVFALIAGTPPALWLMRNLLLTHTLMGPRKPSGLSAFEALRQIVSLLVEWVIPIGGDFALAIVIALVYLRLRGNVVLHRHHATQLGESVSRQADGLDRSVIDSDGG